MLHIHCGDCSAEVLRRSGVPGTVIVWNDPVVEGPTPADAMPEEWRAIRAQYLARQTHGALRTEALEALLAAQDAALERFREHEEVVLWFDACLFDQAILIRQLDWFARQERGATKVSLLTVGEFPNMPDFTGLGELTAEQLASLFPGRHEVTQDAYALAQRAWAAYCSGNPIDIEAVLQQDTSALPYLRDALGRHLEEFPSLRNGLGRLENEALTVIADGAAAPEVVFRLTADKEPRPFFGDTMLWRLLQELADALVPLVKINGPGPLPSFADKEPGPLTQWSVTITTAGCEVLMGEADRVWLNGIDRWYGGVHQYGNEVTWRWDEQTRLLIRMEG